MFTNIHVLGIINTYNQSRKPLGASVQRLSLVAMKTDFKATISRVDERQRKTSRDR